MGAEKSPTWPADYARRRLWARSSDRGSIPRASTNPLRRKQAAWLYESKAERLSVIAPLIPCFPAILSCRICQLDELAGKKRFRLSSGLPIARCVEAIMLRRNQGGYMPLELVRQAYRNFCGALDWFSLSVGGVGVSRGGVEFVPVDAGPVCGRDAVVRFGRRCLFALPQGVGDE